VIFMANKNNPIGGSYTITHGSVTSTPIRYNASQKYLDRIAAETAGEDAAVQALRVKRKKRAR
jgi:hypothetical protein